MKNRDFITRLLMLDMDAEIVQYDINDDLRYVQMPRAFTDVIVVADNGFTAREHHSAILIP